MYIPGANIDVNLVIRQVPTISTIPIAAPPTPLPSTTIINPIATPTSGVLPPAPSAPTQSQGSCIGSGSLAGGIIGSIIGTLLICYAIYALRARNANTSTAKYNGGGGGGGRYDGNGGGYGVGHGAGGFEGRKSGHAADVGRDGKKRYSGYDTKIEAAPHGRRSRSRRGSIGGGSGKSYSSYDRTARPERVVYRD